MSQRPPTAVPPAAGRPGPSRLGLARRRLQAVKALALVGSLAAFTGTYALARVGHPAKTKPTQRVESVNASPLAPDSGSGDGFDQGSIAPAQSAPTFQSGGS
jgi:hypothetical protein